LRVRVAGAAAPDTDIAAADDVVGIERVATAVCCIAAVICVCILPLCATYPLLLLVSTTSVRAEGGTEFDTEVEAATGVEAGIGAGAGAGAEVKPGPLETGREGCA